MLTELAAGIELTLYKLEGEPHRARLTTVKELTTKEPEAFSVYELIYSTRKGRITLLQTADTKAARNEFARRATNANGSTRHLEYEGVVILLIAPGLTQDALDELTLEVVPKE